MIDKKFNLLF